MTGWRLFYGAAMVMAMAGVAGDARAEGCVRLTGPPEVIFSHNSPVPVYNTRLSQREIEALAFRTMPSHQVIGLTATTWNYRIESAFFIQPRQSPGQFCVYLTRLKMDVGYNDTTVYIANKYRPGSCQYQAIREHENEHLRIFEEMLLEYLPTIRRSIQAAAEIIGPVWTTRPNEAKRMIGQRIRYRLDSHVDKLERETSKTQAAIDTPENYRRVQANCPSW